MATMGKQWETVWDGGIGSGASEAHLLAGLWQLAGLQRELALRLALQGSEVARCARLFPLAGVEGVRLEERLAMVCGTLAEVRAQIEETLACCAAGAGG